MALFDKLYSASYKGVTFLMNSGTTQAGRKTVTHEYPNSDRRFVEDLGKLQKTFSIEGIITSNQDDYFQRRDALINALDSSGGGVLIHPFYGSVNVVSTTYTISETMTQLNRAVFTMNFERADLNIFPTTSSSNLSQISSLDSAVNDSLAANIIEVYIPPINQADNFADATTQLQDIATAFETSTREVLNDVNEISNFAATIIEFEDGIIEDVANPPVLASNMIQLLNDAYDTADTARGRFQLFSSLFTFGDDDVVILPTTIARQQRKSNRDTLRVTVQVGSLSKAYVAASLIDYQNDVELSDTKATLEEQYNKIIDDDLIDSKTAIEIKKLRNQARIFFENEALNVDRLITINTKNTNLTALTYQYYGNLDRFTTIRKLNNITTAGYVEGEITILASSDDTNIS